MSRLPDKALQLSLALMLAALPVLSHARNTKLLLPIGEVMRSPGVRQSIGSDLGFYFGSTPATAVAGSAGGVEILARAVATPERGRSRYDEGESDRRTCREAFRLALAELSNKARMNGGNAIVSIVSFYGGVEMASFSDYECHAGYTRSVVELKGRVAKIDASQLEPPKGVAGADATWRGNASETYSVSGDIADTSLLPYSTENMIAGYKSFLTKPYPRAFAITSSGNWRSSWGSLKNDPTPAVERVIRDCEKNSGRRCFLYAVDDRIVYRAPANSDPINDTALLPKANESMVERYRYFLTRPLPRAFAISDDSRVWIAWGSSDGPADTAAQRAIRDCEKNYEKRCFLYAVDDTVVYKPFHSEPANAVNNRAAD